MSPLSEFERRCCRDGAVLLISSAVVRIVLVDLLMWAGRGFDVLQLAIAIASGLVADWLWERAS